MGFPPGAKLYRVYWSVLTVLYVSNTHEAASANTGGTDFNDHRLIWVKPDQV